MIGEAPGAEEDKRGECFVGRAGKVLDEVMASIGLNTNQDLLIVNIVKCRPPDNRPPRAEEALACASHLEKQIRLFHPEIILLLGRTALKHILPELAKIPMKESAGKIFEGIFFEEKIKILFQGASNDIFIKSITKGWFVEKNAMENFYVGYIKSSDIIIK